MTKPQSNTRGNAADVLANIRRKKLADGSRIAESPLPGGNFATRDQSDLTRLLALGIGPAWYLNSNGRGFHYVRVDVSARFAVPSLVQVARLIAEPPLGHVVKHLDGDRLNLRRANLVTVRRSSRAIARERSFGEMVETMRPSASLEA